MWQHQQLPRSAHVRTGRQKTFEKIIPGKGGAIKISGRETSEVWKCPKILDFAILLRNGDFLRNEYFGGVRKVGDNFFERKTRKELFRNKLESFLVKTKDQRVHGIRKMYYFIKMPFLASYYFIFFLNEQLEDKFLRMLGFEPWISDVGSDRSTNWATNTTQMYNVNNCQVLFSAIQR